MAFKKNSTLYEAPPQKFIACCFDGCPNNANVRIFTKTGWANVCARVDASDTTRIYHYDKLERATQQTRNRVLDEMRETFRKSPYSRRLKEGSAPKGHVSHNLRDEKFDDMMADFGQA